ncbi:penicillin-insensitive murein endopeptidase [Ketogulonicigenium robustum]|nr:penicillin-insensitive murein endopeptidase [Ketogulonicigenium robustum]
MRKIGAALVLLAALAACRGEQADPNLQAHLSDRRIARDVFGPQSSPANIALGPIGGYALGCQAGAVQLPETGPTWQAMRLSRNRNWAQPQTVGFVQDLSRFAATLPGWDGLYVGDMSQPRGGPMSSGHASHQSGLDMDIWMLPPDRLNLTRAEREAISSRDMQRARGAAVNSSWTPQHEALLRRAAEDPRVARIFVFGGAKVEMCRNATGDRSWLSKIRPWAGHNTHFHVRLNCPAGATYCADQAPPPAGDGCAEAEAFVANILNPPPARPRDPNAPPPAPPRGPLQVNELPVQCTAVLAAR